MEHFAKSYSKLRVKEGRTYSDEHYRSMPYVKNHALEYEWKIRAKTMERFISHLNKINVDSILEIGCGVGWFAYNISLLDIKRIDAIDIHPEEIEIAKSMFKHENLAYYVLDVFNDELTGKYDLIVLNASIQYFPDLEELILCLKRHLNPNGSIHVMDSPVHNSLQNALKASNRSQDYFSEMGFSELSNHFNHHAISDFPSCELMYKYGVIKKIQSKMGIPNSPFPWIRIKP